MHRTGRTPRWLVSIVLPFVVGCSSLADDGSSLPSSNSSITSSSPTPAFKVSTLLARADAGDLVAQNALGICYLHGLGVVRDYAGAAKWFRKAAAGGNRDG